MTTLAIIPARGGSKGVKKKNLRKVGGVSLVGRAIKCAKESGVMDHILVTTEDEEIRQEALKYGAEVPFLRPTNLADDYATMAETVAHAIKEFEKCIGNQVTIITLIEPTNPFRKSESLKNTLELYKTGKYKSVMTVCSLERKPNNIFVKGEFLTRFIEKPIVEFQRRQEMKHLCRLSSVCSVTGRNEFLEHNSLQLNPMGYIETTPIEAINIDEKLDLEIADFIAGKFNI